MQATKPVGTVNILGIVTETHDAGIALVQNGVPLLVIEEERLNRQKHTTEFPVLALNKLFEDGKISLADIDVITTPWDMRRLRRTVRKAVFGNFPASLSLLLQATQTTQERGIVLLNFWLRFNLKYHFRRQRLPPIINVGHHESHAAIYFASPFEEASILVMDGYGDDAATSTFTGVGNRIEHQWHGQFFDSLGMIYTLITRYLGFQVFEEGTVMALAACGGTTLVDAMRDIVHLQPAGQFSINMDYFSHHKYGMLKPFTPRFIETFGPPRTPGEALIDRHRDIARALQTVTEEVVLHVTRHLAAAYPSRNLVLTGGVALNCVANARILRDTPFRRVWVPPCASDTGAPLGSALWHHHQTLGQPRVFEMTHAFYGSAYSSGEMRRALIGAGLEFQELDEDELLQRVAHDLANDKIVGWFQGRFEMGPRALGNRSILASPLRRDIRDLINTRIKYRESFRPFAPAVLAEYAGDYFDISQPDPYMTLAPGVRPDKVEVIPAAVHVDGTARIQTVEREFNPRYYGVIEQFMKLTGVPVVLNTSFNKQEPIVARPEEAISCFLRTEMDTLVLGNFYTRHRPAGAVARARDQFAVLDVNIRGGE
jgi:carbamoyltransferase